MAQKRCLCLCVCVCESSAGFLFFILWEKTPSCPARADSPNQELFQLQQNFAPSSALLTSYLSASPGYFSILIISFSHSQGRGSNVIHCRKDGTWSGSFHLCREMQGQCALPTQLNSHLKLQCAGGYGIGG